jgi:2-isopropylmalate synthase
MGYELEPEDFERLFEAFKVLADKKKEVFNEDLEALIADEILRIPAALEAWIPEYRQRHGDRAHRHGEASATATRC